LGSSNAHVGGWSDFYNDGDEAIMRDEAYRVAGELGVTVHSLPVAERIQRISEWMGWQNSDTTPFQWLGEKDGYIYDCTTSARGAVSLFRLAGIPAVGISMKLWGESHEEPFFYDEDGKIWMHADWTANYGSSEKTFTEYFGQVQTRVVSRYPFEVITTDDFKDYYQLSVTVRNPGTEMSTMSIDDYIFDIDETWINYSAESFMLTLLQQPYAYPDKKLTRGEVARLLCNYLGVIPMRNEQVFSDVPTSHRYSKYIWAINKLGIMNGVGDGKFNPDAELSMQEFAVMAMNAVNWSKVEMRQEIDGLKSGQIPVAEYSSLEATIGMWEKFLSKLETPSRAPKVFADSDQIANWAKVAVDELSRFRILQGDSTGSDSRLNPTEALSKIRFLVFLYKFDKELDLRNKRTSSSGGLQF
jgi:hypothetical protein